MDFNCLGCFLQFSNFTALDQVLNSTEKGAEVFIAALVEVSCIFTNCFVVAQLWVIILLRFVLVLSTFIAALLFGLTN